MSNTVDKVKNFHLHACTSLQNVNFYACSLIRKMMKKKTWNFKFLFRVSLFFWSREFNNPSLFFYVLRTFLITHSYGQRKVKFLIWCIACHRLICRHIAFLIFFVYDKNERSGIKDDEEDWDEWKFCHQYLKIIFFN